MVEDGEINKIMANKIINIRVNDLAKYMAAHTAAMMSFMFDTMISKEQLNDIMETTKQDILNSTYKDITKKYDELYKNLGHEETNI